MNQNINSPIINPDAIEPLFDPWVEPNCHRVRAEDKGPPVNRDWRRPSPIPLVNPLRVAVREWRDIDYPGISDTTRYLLDYWFNRDHFVQDADGIDIDFRYYFCQREAIETLIYLMERRNILSLSSLISQFGGDDAETWAKGVNPKSDAWPRYAFKLATGTGKTKCMSLAIVWSYFHALKEDDSIMAKNFIVIAPNLTVFERLKEDFYPEKDSKNIFDKDPLIPPEWRGYWNFSTILQDEPAGAITDGTLYLTNIHRLYPPPQRVRGKKETYSWAGPPVSKSTPFDASEELRKRIASHRRIMVMNDEAHHVWDPQSTWSEAINWLHETIKQRVGIGLVAQLDFSATPKDNAGRVFQHVVCDTPLGEAVDAGIVKTPVIGHSTKLIEQPNDDASHRYETHLRIGYERWQRSQDEWKENRKSPLLFVMCENTKAADEIAKRLNTDPIFENLNGKTVNLHTNLKGRMRRRKINGETISVFEENENAINDSDLKELRRISRELDNPASRYACIVSVLMLREGWDVRNVTTIVPLRKFTAKARILPEQTLGRGLRRMIPAGRNQVNEVVSVVEHPIFTNLYKDELAQEGVIIQTEGAENPPRRTVTIFPDEGDKSKNLSTLNIELPSLTRAHEIQPKLQGISIEDVKKSFGPHSALPLGGKGKLKIKYEGRQLFTDEIVEQMEIHLALLQDGLTAISFYKKELEMICKVQDTHQILAPLLKTFLEEILFDETVALQDQRLKSRLTDDDVRESIRATFTPLIREKTVMTHKRLKNPTPLISLRNWLSYQVTFSKKRPALPAKKTLFNLVPCNLSDEEAMTKFLDRALDVDAFAKNAGPQALRIDYLALDNRPTSYIPDFFVRTSDKTHYIVETKGRKDDDLINKVRAAREWCSVASEGGVKWEYVLVPHRIMTQFSETEFASLVRACAPELNTFL